MNSQERVEKLLTDRAGTPWEESPRDLRERTVAALAGVRRLPGPGGVWAVGLAAAVAAMCAGTLVYFQGRRAMPAPVAVRIDPAAVLGPPTLDRLALNAERSLRSEAQELLEGTERVTRRVLAQLPFTGGS